MGVSEEDITLLTETISEYRNSWAQDRLERMRQWMENLFYWRGIQVIRWDTATNCWYDALAWARNNSQESGEDTDLERWINPLVLMFCNVFTGIMSQAIPKTIVKPQNADPKLQDTVTAKAAVTALDIGDRKNQFPMMIGSIYEQLFLFGSYFRYTRAVIDGEMFGYDEEAQFEDMQIENGPHYVCPNCGTETPATSPDGMECPNCGAYMGQESYYAAGEGNRTSLKQSGVKKIPKAGVKQSLISCLEFDMDPKAKGKNPMKQTAIASYDVEIDFGEACMMCPKFRDMIEPGAEVSTTANASTEKLNRLNAVSALGGMTADNSLMNPTYSRNWVQPMAYFKKKNWEFAQRMQQKFPEGLLLSMIGPVVVDIRPANLQKEITHCALYANQGVYCHALADTAVSFNARFNRAMWIIDDWASRASTGMNFADGGRIDTEKMSGKQMPAGTLTNVPMRVNGEPRPMSELIMHYDMPLNPALLNYPEMLLTFCELIIGIPRQASGQGTQAEVDTFHGQQLMVDRAQTVLKPYFKNVQYENASASQNYIWCLQALMNTGAVKEIRDVVEAKGGAFQNQEVDWTKMQGNVNITYDEDQDLPISPDQLRTSIETMFKELTSGNPAAAEWFAVPANQDTALSSMLPGTVNPDEAQRLKTEADIQTIVDQGLVITQNPDGSQTTDLPVHPERVENFPVAKQIVQRYMLEHYELRLENPTSWVALGQYYQELNNADTAVAADTAKRQQAVTQAGAPPQPQPDPGTMAAVQELQKLATQMADRLAQLSMVDPLVTKQTITGQKDAAGKIIDSAMDATKAMMGEK